MFLNRILAAAPTEIEKLLLEQQETLRKLAEIKVGVEKLKNGSITPSIGQMYDASNTLKTPIFDMSNISWIQKAENFFNATDKVINWITHPVLIMNGLAGVSFYIAAAIGITGLVFYICGYKKGMKFTVGSVLGYFIIQTINWGANLL